MHESLNEKGNQWPVSSLIHCDSSVASLVDSDGDGGGKMPAVDRHPIQDVRGIQIVDLLESDDDDSPIVSRKSVKTTGVAQGRVDDDVVDLTQDEPTAVVSVPLPKLTIYIDSRERNRNATPRLLRTELTRLLSGPLKIVWPNDMMLADVEEKELGCGDFAFQLQRNAYGNRLPVLVERKRIGDLVQRSAKKDHWWQLQKMRDMNTTVGLFLLEGDLRQAAQYTAFGSQEDEGWTPTNHTIDSEETIIRFMGRAILSSDSLGFIQTKDEQGSLRFVAVLGLMSATASHLSQRAPVTAMNMKVEKKRLADRLEKGGIPFQVAHRVAEEIGSMKQMDLLYASADNDECRDALLVPVIAGSCSELGSKSNASRWSAACHRVYFSALSEPADARKIYSEYEHLVEDRATLLSNLHAGMTPEEALDVALNDEKVEDEPSRSVSIELSKDGSVFRNCFAADNHENFYRLKPGNPQLHVSLPVMSMRTEAGLFRASRLFIFLLEGEQLVERVKQSLTGENRCFVASARVVADKIRADCCDTSMAGKERRVLVIRGLQPALDSAAKKPGYNSVLRVMVDMVLADIMIAREIERMCVLQAVRLSNDLQVIVQQLALACFHFQLLTGKKNMTFCLHK
jgi:ERCC4-type nuclease